MSKLNAIRIFLVGLSSVVFFQNCGQLPTAEQTQVNSSTPNRRTPASLPATTPNSSRAPLDSGSESTPSNPSPVMPLPGQPSNQNLTPPSTSTSAPTKWNQKIRSSDGKLSWSFVDGQALNKLESLFQGTAKLNYVRPMPVDPGAAWIIVHDGTWYLYDRNDSGLLANAGPREFCKDKPTDSGLLTGTTVRTSKDQGKTWSDFVYVAWPSGVSGSPDACQVLDGSTFFDIDSGVWHLWAQCLGDRKTSPWRMCHYQASSPMGPFKLGAVTNNGDIWKLVCAQNPTVCGGDVSDEGTPEILYKKDGFFYVSLHGFQFNTRYGFRATVKTRDFATFIASGADLPTGPTLTQTDCSMWNPDCIGFGASSTLLTDSSVYVLSEGPTKSLDCVVGQNWSWGIMKGTLTTATGQWQQSPMNPLVKGIPGVQCAVAYLKLFQDGNDLYGYYTTFSKNGLKLEDRTFNLYKVETTQVSSNVPPTQPSGNIQRQVVSPPLVDYWQPVADLKHRDNAWIATSHTLAHRFCEKKFGAGWTHDSPNSKSTTDKVNICNVSLEVDSGGRIYCSEGVSGSYFEGQFFTTIACKK